MALADDRKNLTVLGKVIATLPVEQRFMLFCELERKVDSDRVGKIPRGQVVLVYVPETTRSKEKTWKQAYWTLGRVYRCGPEFVHVNEVHPNGGNTGLQLKLPRQFAIPVDMRDGQRTTDFFERLAAIDSGLEVATAPFTTNPAHFGQVEAAFFEQNEPDEPKLKGLKIHIHEDGSESAQEERQQTTKPSGIRKKKGRFGLKKVK